MSLVRVGETVYLHAKPHWFVWEPAWDSYRPITSVVWDGVQTRIDDRAYCADPLDPLYGYGTSEMKALCMRLTSTYPPSSAVPGPLPAIGPTPEWFYDRFLSLSPCTPRDRASWKRFHKGRYWTPRSAPKTRLTRRR